LRGPARASIAQLHMLAKNSTEAVEWATLARADAESIGDDATAARAKVEAASALIAISSRGEAMAAMTDALEHARRSGDAVLLCRAINNSLELVPPHSAEGRALRQELIEASRRVGFDKLGVSVGLLWEVAAAHGDGDLAAQRRASAEGEQWWGGRDSEHCWVLGWQVSYAIEEGRLDDARVMLDRLSNAERSWKDPARTASLSLELAAATSDRHAGEAAYEALLGQPPPYDVTSSLDATIGATETALAIGIAPDRVRGELIGGWLGEHPSVDTIRAHTDGLLLAAAGDHHGAAAALGAVLEHPNPCLSKPLVGSLRTVLAASLANTGDRAGALLAVRRVLDDDLARWPGVRRDRAQALARRLEGSSARPDGELTSREREVAALLADGLTNGQLAERLYISPKTAAVHVSNILAKLGLSSRAEIAAWAVRHGIALKSA
jgi:DNA-binding CsgD family transcriptional regulator